LTFCAAELQKLQTKHYPAGGKAILNKNCFIQRKSCVFLAQKSWFSFLPIELAL